jgi:hypothetical protein
MGLDLQVGILADLKENDEEAYEYYRAQFEALNQCLQAQGLPPHREPEGCQVWSCQMWGYSGLHYLRRIASCLDLTGELPPPGDDNSSHDPVAEKYYTLATQGPAQSFLGRLLGKKAMPRKARFGHLMLHSDAEGYYLPLNLEEVVFPDPQYRIAGGMVGSTPRLLAECRELATLLEIPDDLHEQSDALWEAAATQGEGEAKWERYGVESFSCVCLMRACEASLKSGAAIVFC